MKNFWKFLEKIEKNARKIRSSEVFYGGKGIFLNSWWVTDDGKDLGQMTDGRLSLSSAASPLHQII